MGDRAPVGRRTVLRPRKLVDVSGMPRTDSQPEGFVHLQFRRFAGCPICNVHLQSIIRGHDEIVATGIREVVVFHSSAQELRRHVVDVPFAVVADPAKVLYAEFGVRSSARALLDPRAMAPVLGPTIRRLATRGSRAPTNNHPTGGRLGLPADFLIDCGGRVVACKYGSHAYDQWSVGELLAHAR